MYVALLSSSPGHVTALAKAKCKMETSHLSISHTDSGGCHSPVVDGVGQELCAFDYGTLEIGLQGIMFLNAVGAMEAV